MMLLLQLLYMQLLLALLLLLIRHVLMVCGGRVIRESALLDLTPRTVHCDTPCM
jgi:hypothetical protein